MLRLELAQLDLGLDAIKIDDKDAGDGAGGDRDVVIWVLVPPVLDLDRISGCILQPVRRGGPLVARQAGEDGQPFFRKRSGGLEHHGDSFESCSVAAVKAAALAGAGRSERYGVVHVVRLRCDRLRRRRLALSRRADADAVNGLATPSGLVGVKLG